MNDRYCLGIDTSCYTTSIAVANEDFRLSFEGRKMLEVPAGARGLRQSDAFYQHIGNISLLMEQCMKSVDPASIRYIAVSSKPRSTEGSYMPVFLAGLHTARTIGSLLGVPIFEVSHQDSHIQAGLWSCGKATKDKFAAYHVSGGTTELLLVSGDSRQVIAEIGGTSDLNAGQFIDRAGVAMGFNFPCGQQMDKLCSGLEADEIDIPISTNDSYISFSGPESHVQRLIAKKKLELPAIAEVSRGVFLCIARSIERTAVNARRKYEFNELLLVGGVASNSIIKDHILNSSLFKNKGIVPLFADPHYSSDNAAGTSVLGMKLAMDKEKDK